jgi:hypothetical protein
MFKLLLLIAMGVAGYAVTTRMINQGNPPAEPDEMYGSADLHRSAG